MVPKSSLRQALGAATLAYGVAATTLVVYNVRWRYIGTLFYPRRRRPRVLSVVTVRPDTEDTSNDVVKNKNKSKKKVPAFPPPIILLHGMWHDAWYWKPLQTILTRNGYTSHAISLHPGERVLPGGSQRELIQDLEETLLSSLSLDEFILIGHSQGGILAQAALFNSRKIRDGARGIVLLGTYPYRHVPPLQDLWTLLNRRNMYTFPGYAWICLFGKLWNAKYTKHIFLLPTTDIAQPAIKEYVERLLGAPSDGLITMSHFTESFGKEKIGTPALVLGAREDVIYPADLLASAFDERYSNTTHIVAEDQAHCFMDRGWESSMAEPLVGWLEEQA